MRTQLCQNIPDTNKHQAPKPSVPNQTRSMKQKNNCTINGDFLFFLIFLFSFSFFGKKKEHSFTQHRQRHVHTNHLHHEFYYTTYTGESDRRNQASSLRQKERTKSYFTYQSVDFFGNVQLYSMAYTLCSTELANSYYQHY